MKNSWWTIKLGILGLGFLGVCMLIPMALHAATESIVVTLTIRAPIRFILVDEVEDEYVREILDTLSAKTVFFTILTIGPGLDSIPIVCIAEESLEARNEKNVPITVTTFCKKLNDSGKNRHIVGGYIADNQKAVTGHFKADATLEALFQ